MSDHYLRSSLGPIRPSLPGWIVILIGVLGFLSLPLELVTAQELIFPEKPPSEHWFVDEANLIQPEE